LQGHYLTGSNRSLSAEILLPLSDDSYYSSEVIALGAFLILLIVTSVVGNVLVCIAVATDHRLRKLSNLFLVSLAIADLLVAGE
jgi:hypothetical protein